MTGVDAAAHLLQIVTECYELVAAELDREVLILCQHFDGAQYMKVCQTIGCKDSSNLGIDLRSLIVIGQQRHACRNVILLEVSSHTSGG